MKQYFLFFIFSCATLNLALSQITLTHEDLLNMIGSSFTQVEERNDNIAVSPGEPGVNQVWDFRSISIVDSVLITNEFLNPEETLYKDQYPEANIVQRISSPTDPGIVLSSFYQITPSEFVELGSVGTISMPFDSTIFSFEQDTVAFLPLTYQSSFTTVLNDTVALGGIFQTLSSDTTNYLVDGWGTLRLPSGDYECLRLRQDVVSVSSEVVNGVVISMDVQTYIQYDWIGKNNYFLAMVQSQDGETNPNFTNALGFGYLLSQEGISPVDTSQTDTTGIENPVDTTMMDTSVVDTSGIDTMTTSIQQTLELATDVQVYPNPVDESLTLSLFLPETQSVQVSIWDIQGRKMSKLSAYVLAAGSHSLKIPPEFIPQQPGLFFLKLQVGPQATFIRLIKLP
ncbi:MAG: T9SS type A sorting domain-containing protein [Bacteroidota bacterium]